ncbi:MAG: 50S ribosomal protein L23 [Candidatus Kerfeldbacteria bacterium]|nr:50S ribosomal protein L23 [Candidatus Kerfeldbacteria bacterium]
MSIFDRFRKKKDKERLAAPRKPAVPAARPEATTKATKERAPALPIEKNKPAARKTTASAASYQVLIHPLVTEKTVRLADTYAFAVRPDANKRQIAEAVEALYGVKPIAVRVQNILGKYVRYGRFTGQTKHWKKAIIAVKPGETIQLNENV